MKNWIKYIIVIALVAVMPSCEQEVLGPYQMISGYYALDDGSNMSDTFLYFEKGYVTEKVASSKKPFLNYRFQNCSESDFAVSRHSQYSIQNGELIVFGRNMGPVSQQGGVLTIGEVRYSSFNGFANAAAVR